MDQILVFHPHSGYLWTAVLGGIIFAAFVHTRIGPGPRFGMTFEMGALVWLAFFGISGLHHFVAGYPLALQEFLGTTLHWWTFILTVIVSYGIAGLISRARAK